MDYLFVAILKLLDHLVDVDLILGYDYLALVTLCLSLAAITLKWVWSIYVVILIGTEALVLILIGTCR